MALSLAVSTASAAASRSDSLVLAFAGKHLSDERALLARPLAPGLAPVLFAEVATRLSSRRGGKEALTRFLRAFEFSLARGLQPSTIALYSGHLADASLPEAARRILLRTMVLGGHRLGASGQENIFSAINRLVDEGGAPQALKADALRYLSRVHVAGSERTLLRFTDGRDTVLRAAAYQGLAGKAIENRHSDNRERNASLFEEVRQRSSGGLSVEQVKVLAAMGDDSARSYVLSKCAGDAEKIRAAFQFDSGIEHPGLIREALKLMQQEEQATPMGQALAKGIVAPDGPLQVFLGGTTSDVGYGLRLLAVFPGEVARHAAFIRLQSASPDSTIRQAADALTPFLASMNKEEN